MQLQRMNCASCALLTSLLFAAIQAHVLAGEANPPGAGSSRVPPSAELKAPQGGAAGSLDARIQAVLNDAALKKAAIGIDIVALDTGEHVYGHLKDDPFVVASNMKLVTTAAALDLLGPDYRFRTSVYRLGPLDASTGVIAGGLVIRGVGDPNISGRFFNEDVCAVPNAWAAAIKKRGVKEIQGDIIADDMLFDRAYVCPSWPRNQLDHWYCAQVCALSFNDNCLNISIAAGKAPGEPAVVAFQPETSYVNVTRSCVTTANRKDHAIILARKPNTNDITVGGKFWVGSPPLKEYITIHNPALYMATVFKEALEHAGIKVAGSPRLPEGPMKEVEVPENELVASESTMDSTIAVTNKRSQNLYAEQLFKILGALKAANPPGAGSPPQSGAGVGSFESGAAAVGEFLKRYEGAANPPGAGSLRVPPLAELQAPQGGAAPNIFVVADGSGLSKSNRLTPSLMTALLRHMYEHKYRNAFLGSLAVPGEEGSLEKRLKQEPYRSNVLAKTGYVAGASCLSGYATTRKGRVMAFAIFMNKTAASNAVLRPLQDKICKAIVDTE